MLFLLITCLSYGFCLYFLYLGIAFFTRHLEKAFYLVLLIVCAFSWYPDFGRTLGENYFMSKSLSLDISSNLENEQKIDGKILYDGRREIYFLRSDNNKVVKISK